MTAHIRGNAIKRKNKENEQISSTLQMHLVNNYRIYGNKALLRGSIEEEKTIPNRYKNYPEKIKDSINL